MSTLVRRFVIAAALALPSVEVGEALIMTSAATRIVAARGDARTWLAAQQGAAGGTAGALSFIIPTNTCEQGPPLQALPIGRR